MAHPLQDLVCALVPKARRDSVLKDDLASHCQDILNSRIGQNVDTDIGHLADIIKRQLLQSSPDGVSTLRFTNLLSRLLDQSILTRKHATLQFLHSLSLSSRPTSISPALLPSLAPPPLPRPSSKPVAIADGGVPPSLPKGKSKAEVLKEYRAKTGQPHLPGYLILRDTLYLLQGISGKYVHFSPSAMEDGNHELVFTDDPRYIISSPAKSLVHRLAEVGHLYMRVDAFLQEREGHEGRGGVGMIEQSLCHHLQSQLTEYYRLIAVLESQMAMGGHAVDSSDGGGDGEASARGEESGLTLKRLDVWIEEWRLRMRMMSACVEGARGAHGGALVNLIHSYADNGDPFVRKFTDQLLEEVSKPFFATLHKWLFSGELIDPFAEFFVAVDPELAHVQYAQPEGVGPLASDGGFGGNRFGLDNGVVHGVEELGEEREGGLKLWQSKYRFQKDMLPAFVGEAFGRKIFSIGKSLNFIRYMCQDSEWVATREKLSNTGGTLKYSDIAGLERSIDTAYQIASQRLFEVLFEKYKLLDHLLALKRYLLLGYGDFVDHLMEAMTSSLARPANTLYRHNLTATLESAIRSSNAQNDPPDVLRRLDVRMLEYSHGEIGWDVFTLEYKVDAPIDMVLDPDSMASYLKIFSHLWKIKRIESTLSKMWMRIASGARTFLRVPELNVDWHQIRIVMAEMIHFIRQIETYCQLDVIECSWKVLREFIQEGEGDLDALIEAHRVYLNRTVKKALLLNPKAKREENLLNQVKEVFAIILQFREATDDFYNYCLSESARRDSERDEERGVYTASGVDKRYNPDVVLDIINRVRGFGSSFSERVQTIVQALQNHSDPDCRSLATRLSFSDFYKVKKEQQKS